MSKAIERRKAVESAMLKAKLAFDDAMNDELWPMVEPPGARGPDWERFRAQVIAECDWGRITEDVLNRLRVLDNDAEEVASLAHQAYGEDGLELLEDHPANIEATVRDVMPDWKQRYEVYHTACRMLGAEPLPLEG